MFTFLFYLNFFIIATFARKPEIVAFPSIFTVESKEFYELNCNLLKGTKPIHFEWFKNDIFMTSDMNLSIDYKPSSSRLTFSEFQSEHSGNYTCKASNSDGFDQSSTILQIKGLLEIFQNFDLFTNSCRYVALVMLNF